MLAPNGSGLHGGEAPESRGQRGLSVGPSHSVKDDDGDVDVSETHGEDWRGHHVPWQTQALTAQREIQSRV